MMKRADCALIFVTDDRVTEDEAFLKILVSSLEGGITMVQLREKFLSTKRFYQRAQAVKKLCARYEVPLIINDRLDIALSIDAEGIHLGQSDLPVEIARNLLGNKKIIGYSVSNAKQMMTANQLEIDYIGLSPIFQTVTKKTNLAPPMGIEGLKRLKTISTKPLVCIGGITPENTKRVLKNGSDGIAVVSAISQAEDPEEAARTFTSIIRKTKAENKFTRTSISPPNKPL